jgi:hypothetical protein
MAALEPRDSLRLGGHPGRGRHPREGAPLVHARENVPGDVWENTPCPGCSTCVIRRRGFEVLENRVSDGRCPDCATPIAGVWR